MNPWTAGRLRTEASGAREAAPGDGRLVRVELGRGGLHGREAIRRQLTGVLLLDALQPGRALRRAVDVHVHRRAGDVLVDLLEEHVDELLLRHLAQRLSAREDETLVLGAGDPEVRVR